MKLKELKKALALSVAVSMAAPGSVWAAAPGENGSAAIEQNVEEQAEEGSENPEPENPEPENPEPENPEPENPEPENPEPENPEPENPEPENPEPENPEPENPEPENPEPENPEPENPEPENPEPENPEPENPEPENPEPENPEPENPEPENPEPENPEPENPEPENPEPENPEPENPEPENPEPENPEPENPEPENPEPETPEEPVQEESQNEAVSEGTPSTNEELVANQQIVQLPVMVEDFRFWTVARKYAFAVDNIEIKEEMNQESRSIGSLAKDGLCYILKEEEGWMYVESGRVRGFVQTEQVKTGDEAQELLTGYQKQAKEKAAAEGTTYTGIEGTAPMAQELVPWQENNAFLYLRATVNQTVVDKDYAVTTASLLNVREGKGTDTRIVGTLPQGSLCYILADKDQDWVYIESGDVRGFVSRQYIVYDETVKAAVEQAGEESYTTADKLVEPSDNQACYYTLTSVKSGVPGGEVRSSVVEFASQFIGNPYVWGGTSLTEGADCSGFVQSIYKEYGVELPRVAEDQAQYGTKIAVEDAQPGDLVFYARNGYIYHVVIYAGNGKTVEAKGRNYGIVQDDLNTASAVWATRVLEGGNYVYSSGDIAEVNATEDMYGDYLGNYKLTYYCSCELCCDVETGITATGTPVVEGQTIAVDPRVIPYGTQVIINGHVFTAEDCGGAIKGNRIDIYVNDHDRANALGVNYADVYLVK